MFIQCCLLDLQAEVHLKGDLTPDFLGDLEVRSAECGEEMNSTGKPPPD